MPHLSRELLSLNAAFKSGRVKPEMGLHVLWVKLKSLTSNTYPQGIAVLKLNFLKSFLN
jgi:hypothetical protein